MMDHIQLNLAIRGSVAGFCGETDDEHAATMDLMQATRFDSAFMFAYSQRDKTAASRHLQVLPLRTCRSKSSPD